MIRPATGHDLAALYRIAADMGTTHEPNYFERCLAEQNGAKRSILIAEQSGQPVGYVQLIWLPIYAVFRRLGMPEIQDLNVIPAARQQGLGGQLVAACEKLARAAGKTEIGISVGLHARFGAAQRLYISKEYIPDGAGACYDEIPVKNGELRPIDDLLTLKFIKQI